MPPQGQAHGLWPGSDTSRRNAPQTTMTLQVLGWVLLGAVLPGCLGLLLGATWTTQALQPRLSQQAEERRRLNEEWSAVRTARRQRGQCPRCGSPLSGQDWYLAPTPVQDPPNDD